VSNLIARILTATVLGGGVVYGILRLPAQVMVAAFALILCGAAFEWAALAGFVTRLARGSYAAVTVAAALGCALALDAEGTLLTIVLGVGCAAWCGAAVWIVHYQRHQGPRLENPLVLALSGWLALVPALAALLSLLARGPTPLLALFALVWGADIFAYFGGKRFGKRRLASRVSPGKTWEGLLSALLGTQALALAGIGLFKPMSLAALLALTAVTFVASVVGDLLESLLKRLRGVKDSGNLLPGHGGLLDRIDSLLAAAPVFTLGLILMEQP
jgi:phosphatidate cytidylyltransferase